MTSLDIGKAILALAAAFTAVGPSLADFNHTHVYNTNCPPHARFHNGQTMSTGLALGLSALYFLYRRPSASSSLAHNLNIAIFLIHLYYIPCLSGGLYPGALFLDPEFGEGRPQIWIFSVIMGVSWAGWWIARKGIADLGTGVEKRM